MPLIGDEIRIGVWREVPKASGSNFQKKDYAELPTPLWATVQPWAGGNAIKNGQVLSDIKEYLQADDPDFDLRNGDELVIGTELRRVLYVDRHKLGILPHLEVYTTTTQWTR